MDPTRISAIEGNSQWLDGGAMFGNAPRPVWEKWVEVDAKHRIKLASRGLLIEIDGVRILCETGIGAFFEPKLAERYGVTERTHVLLDSLKALGITDADVDLVILSHLHFDHAGGLLPSYEEIAAGNDGLLFPNARYVVGKGALARARAPHARDRASFIPGLVEKLEASQRMVVVDGEHLPMAVRLTMRPELRAAVDRLSFRYTDGHTPGHMHTLYAHDGGRTVFFAGDLIPGTAWVHAPITMGYDRFPELLIDEKQKLYELAVRQHWLVFFTHDTKIPAAEIGVDANGKFAPLVPRTELTRAAI